MSLDKKKVVEFFIKTQEEKIQSLMDSLERTRQDVIDAPGSNVSHSDTMRFQHSNLALGIQRQITEAQAALSAINAIDPTPLNIISEGALFVLKDVGTEETSVYLFVEGRGGVSIEVDNQRIVTLSNEAPLSDSVIRRRRGDKIVNRRGKIFEIVEVQ